MILGVGIDLLDVGRVKREVARDPGFLRQILTPAEIKHCRRSSSRADLCATHFAAKEALFKALGTGKRGGMSWHDIEVTADPPRITLTGATGKRAKALGMKGAHLDWVVRGRDVAAVVVLED
jgi:holo-[acyl-carrier protein] synthase